MIQKKGEDWLQLYEVEGVHQQGLATGYWEIKDKHVHKQRSQVKRPLQLATPPATPPKSGLVVKALPKPDKRVRNKTASKGKPVKSSIATMDIVDASESGSASSEDERDAFQNDKNAAAETSSSESGDESASVAASEDEEYDATPSRKRKATSSLFRDQRPRKYIKRTAQNDKRHKAEQARRNSRLAKKAEKRWSAPR